MGQRGPKPTPTALRVIRGNPGKRALNRAEPRPDRFKAVMPGKVKSSPRAAEEWKRLVPILRRMKVLTEADYIALGNLCWDVALLESTQEKMVNTPLLIRTPAGGFKPNPMLGIVSETADRVSRTLREFGLTPASRSNIRREPDDEAGDEWAEF